MFREFSRFRKPKPSKSIEVKKNPPDLLIQAVNIVRSSGLDPDEEEITIRRLRNYCLLKRLSDLGIWL